MKKVRITVVKTAFYPDLMEKYENPIAYACMMSLNQEFICENGQMPKGFCESAWQNVSPFVFALANGATDLYDGWMKNRNSAMISCNDGFRPVSFYIETIEK